MSKLYFKYGAMGSSKTATALMTRFNYIEKGMKVLLWKPSIDNRDGEDVIKSRIGLEAKAHIFNNEEDLFHEFYLHHSDVDVVIVDEAQFCTEQQVEDLRMIVDSYNIPVFCFGLKTDFQTHLFPGSKRLLEIADSISELKSICSCGKKAIINARIDKDGNIIRDGEQVLIGGNESYTGMCYSCWKEDKIKK